MQERQLRHNSNNDATTITKRAKNLDATATTELLELGERGDDNARAGQRKDGTGHGYTQNNSLMAAGRGEDNLPAINPLVTVLYNVYAYVVINLTCMHTDYVKYDANISCTKYKKNMHTGIF